MNFSWISWFMVTRDVVKAFQIALTYGSCKYFENFQNITCAHKSQNALAFMQFPILIKIDPKKHNFHLSSYQEMNIIVLFGAYHLPVLSQTFPTV